MAIIRPCAELRNNYNEISRICHETQEPVYITKNGTNDLVILSNEAYEKSEDIKITLNKTSIDFEALSVVGDEAKTQIDANLQIEAPYELRVKYKNILDFLGTTNSDSFELKYNEAAMPIMLHSDDLRTIVTQVNIAR